MVDITDLERQLTDFSRVNQDDPLVVMGALAAAAGYSLDWAEDGTVTLVKSRHVHAVLDAGDDAAVVVRHPNGGVTEVLVNWDQDGRLYVFVDPSAKNAVSVEG
jgi:hypothetical protein